GGGGGAAAAVLVQVCLPGGEHARPAADALDAADRSGREPLHVSVRSGSVPPGLPARAAAAGGGHPSLLLQLRRVPGCVREGSTRRPPAHHRTASTAGGDHHGCIEPGTSVMRRTGWLLFAGVLLGFAVGLSAFTFTYAKGSSYLTND